MNIILINGYAFMEDKQQDKKKYFKITSEAKVSNPTNVRKLKTYIRLLQHITKSIFESTPLPRLILLRHDLEE